MVDLTSEFFENITPVEEKLEGKAVSYSQYKMFATCPRQWKLTYADGNWLQGDSIDTIFGHAMHEVIQGWLPIHFDDEKKAKRIDLTGILKEKLILNFKKSIVEKDGTKTFVCDKQTLQEYYEDGCAILGHLQKYGKDFFPTKGYRLVGCEVPLHMLVRPGLRFKAYLDIVIHDIKLNQYHIIDLKTSRLGWYPGQKKDPKRTNQILLYKKFYSQQYNVPVENIFPKFIILKRKIKENSDFIIRRLSNFEPSHGTVSLNKATAAWEKFLNECFDANGNFKTNVKPTPSESNCKYCPFNTREDLCPDSYVLNKKKRIQRNRELIQEKNQAGSEWT